MPNPEWLNFQFQENLRSQAVQRVVDSMAVLVVDTRVQTNKLGQVAQRAGDEVKLIYIRHNLVEAEGN